jgi:hypothetical protein
MLGSLSEADDAVQESWLHIDLLADPEHLCQLDLTDLDDIPDSYSHRARKCAVNCNTVHVLSCLTTVQLVARVWYE